MKKQLRLYFSKYLLIPIVLTLAGCGGGSSNNIETVNNDTTRPIFQERDVVILPNATPTGDITDTTPTFTWNSIQNASEYQYGHENLDTRAWRSYTLLAEDLNCNAIDDICADTPTDFTFTVGDRSAWWVRAKIEGAWAPWSDPHIFKIIPDTENPPIGVPNAITPIGDISNTSPEFSWSSVQDAIEYQLGHEDLDTRTWQSYAVPNEQAGCLAIDQTCTFTPSNLTFELDQRIAWWVRAKVNGVYGEWSIVSVFTLFQEPPPILVPELIAPSGEISSTNPLFSWTVIEGATEYRLNHEETDTELNQQEYVITPTQATCQNANDNCTFTVPAETFNAGDNISWKVRALVDANLQAWSEAKTFNIIDPQQQTNVIINEVLAANTRTNLDPDFSSFSDWIELYNPTSQNINISNFGLSDDDEDPLQWKFPAGTIIEANSYLLVWADDEVNENSTGLHTNFKLSSKGEKLTLTDASGTIIDSIEFDTQESDVSATKQLEEIVFMVPTPGTQNGITYPSKDLSVSPNFSFDSGFFTNSITLTLSQENNAEIFYTTDGSTPNPSSLKFTQAINVNETAVIRAIAIEAEGLPSKIISNSYFINHTSNLPVVSLITDPDNLFDPKTGIYTEGDGSNGVPLSQCSSEYTQPVNYAQEWERPSHMEYFGNNRDSEFSLSLGIEISGQCSRQNEKKSFSFELDSKFGTKKLEYKLFENKDVEKFGDFKLRTGSSGYQVSDILAASLVESGNLNIDYQAYRATQLFVNGEYWGLYNFREKKGGDFIESNYPDIDKDDIDIINQGFEAKRGDTDDYYALEILLNDGLNLDLSNDADYQSILGMFDEDNYIDYMALMIYSANIDWISSNQRSWKEKKPGAKWRWIVDDVDFGFFASLADLNQFTVILESDSSDVMVSLFKALTKNSTFNQKFKSRLNTLLDTTFSPANMLITIDSIVDERYPYIPLENAVWSSIDTDSFDSHIQVLIAFANSRSSIVREQLDNLIPDEVAQ